MGSTSAPNGIVLFNYPSSPFGMRISWYLQLRGIAYALCEQPSTMPRPDLERLGVKYRRIPILAIGRDIYLDTRLILRTLEKKFPDGKIGSDKPEQQFVEKLLERYMVEGPVFQEAAGLVPSAFVKENPTFVKDRKGFLGRDWTPEEMDEGRPANLVFVRNLFDLLETTILADGRDWVLDTERPSLADLQAIWPVDWATKLNMPSHVVSEELFPKVYAWISRFQDALKDAASSAAGPIVMDGNEAASYIEKLGMAVPDGEDGVNEKDPQEVGRGTRVEMYPADWGSEHRDAGRLVGLAADEVTIMGEGAVKVRIHAPRTGFKMACVGNEAGQGGTKL